jgi:hypothetical protein
VFILGPDLLARLLRPARIGFGLYEDAVRPSHPRATGKREDPPIVALQGPGQWTAAEGWIYLWCREGDSPANHRIEASQIVVLTAHSENSRYFRRNHAMA